MLILSWFQNLFLRVLNKFKNNPAVQKKDSNSINSISSEDNVDIEYFNEEIQKMEEFKIHNVVFQKLNYLEQYIKVFSLNFPNEYSKYLNAIFEQRSNYEEELKKFQDGLEGYLTFSIDPECEAQRLISVSNLENEITHFVEHVVNYSIYNDKFSNLCHKLNQFYDAILDTKKPLTVIEVQLNNAISSMYSLVCEVKELIFFKTDSRKKETILNYILYGEYIFFKCALRCKLTTNFTDYKYKTSKFHNLFVDEEYDRLIFKFFIDSLEQYQVNITSYLTSDNLFELILQSCQDLQERLQSYTVTFTDNGFFEDLIKFENTVNNISNNCGLKVRVSPSEIFQTKVNSKKYSVKTIAISVLNMLDDPNARILSAIMYNFSVDISWREFFFLCKIFELTDSVMGVSCNTIFERVKTKFIQFSQKYTEYSDNFIKSEKEKLINYHGSKTKKYVFVLNVSKEYLFTVTKQLRELKLDFIVSSHNVYLNYSYFKGFTNLEKNFSNVLTTEELI